MTEETVLSAEEGRSLQRQLKAAVAGVLVLALASVGAVTWWLVRVDWPAPLVIAVAALAGWAIGSLTVRALLWAAGKVTVAHLRAAEARRAIERHMPAEDRPQ